MRCFLPGPPVCLAFACLVFALPAFAQVNVLTYRNDNARTGQNPNEPLLTPANVNSSQFGLRYLRPVDSMVRAQPLYMAAVPMASGGTHDLILVATVHDSIYAFDADDNAGADAAPLWQASFINEAQGVIPVPRQDVNCGNTELGIPGTPVIDPSTYTIYSVAYTRETAADGTLNYVYRLHALDVRSGLEMPASPVEIQASVPGTGDGGTTVDFIPKRYKQLPALLLVNNVVYVSFGSHCDQGLYHGWIMGYRADTLEQVAVYNNTPNASGASFWGAGAGPAADAAGNVFAVSANGEFDQSNSTPDLGDSVVKLLPANGLSVADYFTPYNQQDLASADLDLGSSGALLLPPAVGSANHPNLLVLAGKEGLVYLLDRDALGGYDAVSNAGALQTLPLDGQGVFGPPAYFSGKVYFSAAFDQLKAFQIANGQLSPSPVSASSETFANPGSSPIVSSNGGSNAILWTFEIGDGGGRLHAFDALDLSNELFSAEIGGYVEFAVPTEADGKVFLGLYEYLGVYGMLPANPGTVNAAVNAASYNTSIAPGSLISIFGSNLARATTSAVAIPLPVSLADTSVFVNGVRAPLLYMSSGQVNAQVPMDTPVGPASVTVVSSGASTNVGTFEVVASAPQIFIAPAGRLFALNQDNSINSPSNPAAPGSVLQIFLTGATSFTNPSATIGTASAQFTYVGPAPGSIGVQQVNVRVPNLPPGDYPLQITLGGVASNTGLVSVD